MTTRRAALAALALLLAVPVTAASATGRCELRWGSTQPGPGGTQLPGEPYIVC